MRILRFEGSDTDVTRYEFAVDGDAQRATPDGSVIPDGGDVETESVHGVLGPWIDAYCIDGAIDELTVDGPGRVTLDGKTIDPANYGDDLPHLFEIKGEGITASVSVSVEGRLAYDGDVDPKDDATIIAGSTLETAVKDDVVRLRFSGALTDVTFLDGRATIHLDGTEIDPDDVSTDRLYPHVVVFDGTDGYTSSSYRLRISGEAIAATDVAGSVGDGPVVTGRTIRGEVGPWYEAYWFQGTLEDATVRGNADVEVSYNVRGR